MTTRFILGGLLIGALVLSLYIDTRLDFAWTSFLLLTGLGIRGAWEWNRAMLRGPKNYAWILLAAAGLYPVLECAWILRGESSVALEPIFFFALVGALAARSVISAHVADGLDRMSRTLLGFVLLYLFYRMLPVLLDRRIGGGLAAAYALVFTSKACDIGAYLVGRTLGKKKLIPEVSPGKTVAGAYGGLVFSGVVGFFCLPWAVPAPAWAGVLFGIWIGAVTMLSDLVESLVKRCAGLKDSARLLPEMGGVLDLIDSLILGAPAGYAFLAALRSIQGGL